MVWWIEEEAMSLVFNSEKCCARSLAFERPELVGVELARKLVDEMVGVGR